MSPSGFPPELVMAPKLSWASGPASIPILETELVVILGPSCGASGWALEGVRMQPQLLTGREVGQTALRGAWVRVSLPPPQPSKFQVTTCLFRN